MISKAYGWTSTTGAGADVCRIPGVLAAGQFLDSAVYFKVGPTGRSWLWPEQLGVLMPEVNTTDPGFNSVDTSWMGDATVVLVQLGSGSETFGEPAESTTQEAIEAVRPLAEVIRDLRSELGMSVEDVAAMCGVKRRQLYNLMAGRSTGTGQETHIRKLAALVSEIWEAADRNPERVRSVALHPIEGHTFYDVAVNRDYTRLDELADGLKKRLREGTVRGSLRRPSPRRRRYARSGAVAEAYGDDSAE